MLGAIIGDIVGSRFEFHNHRSKDFALFVPSCFVTDDSIMTLAVAQALMDTAVALEVLSLAGPVDADDGAAGNANRPATTAVTWTDDTLQLLSQNTIRAMQQIGRQYPDGDLGRRR